VHTFESPKEKVLFWHQAGKPPKGRGGWNWTNSLRKSCKKYVK
jgi:hypothetical protein